MKTLLQSKIFRFALIVCLAFPVFAQDFSPEQYRKALWMSTRFLGAQRSGQGPNWIMQQTAHPTSFVKDNYNGHDVSGGWFDCGDHVMFGHTQYYSAYIIARAVAAFPLAWHDDYTGDYSDYLKTGDYSMQGGDGNGIPDILEELRYEADFVMKAAPDLSTFIIQKGDANKDHIKWTYAGLMSTLNAAQGGEMDVARSVFANPNDAYSPGMASAFLSIMARIDPDKNRASKYRKHAVNAFYYAMQHQGVQSAAPYYASANWNGRWKEARALAGYELYKTTNDTVFRNYAKVQYDSMLTNGIYSRFEYANAIPLARLLMQTEFDFPFMNQAIESYLQRFRDSLNSDGVSTVMNQGGFATRGPIGSAYLHALYSSQQNTQEFDSYIYDQVDYILGSNHTKQAYLVGWDESGIKQVTAPHHRGYWLNENYITLHSPADFNLTVGPTGTRYLGGVIGGALDGSYKRDVEDYVFNESCIDMNATWIGALAYIVQKHAPSESPWVSIRHSNRIGTDWSIVQKGDIYHIQNMPKSAIIRIVDSHGHSYQVSQSQIELNTPGVYFVQLLQKGKALQSKAIVRLD